MRSKVSGYKIQGSSSSDQGSRLKN